jgi:hypothetical protein
MDQVRMQSVMEMLEQAAEEALECDSSFHEALRSLKSEIDRDPIVQSAMEELQAAGQHVFSAFAPRVNVRIRTDEGVINRTARPVQPPLIAKTGPVDRLTLELRSAAGAVIKNSRYCDELSVIVNEAVSASHYFEEIAEEIERAGYRVLICLDLSSYVQIEDAAAQNPGKQSPSKCLLSPVSMDRTFSDKDRSFLKGIGIRLDENTPGAAI